MNFHLTLILIKVWNPGKVYYPAKTCQTLNFNLNSHPIRTRFEHFSN